MKTRVKVTNLKSTKPGVGIAFFLLLIWLPAVQLSANYTKPQSTGLNNMFANHHQIVLQTSMFVDEISAEICDAADVLVDEQSYTPDFVWHPISDAWNPKNHDQGSIYIDLGQIYSLTGIALHNLGVTNGLEVSVGGPGNWDKLITLESERSNEWEQTEISTVTRYVKLTANNIDVSVNEFVLYGNLVDETVTVKSGLIPGLENKTPEDFGRNSNNNISINQDLVTNQLCLSVPKDLSHNFTIEVYNLNGVKMMQKEFVYNISTKVLLDITNSCDRCGIYILRYYNDSGIQRTLKFLKKN